jgi:hypothetical protein
LEEADKLRQTSVIFANNAAEAGAVDIEVMDGNRLRTRVIGLSFVGAGGVIHNEPVLDACVAALARGVPVGPPL